jgi:hypothetical protein
MLSCCGGQLLRAMVDVTIFCPNLAQFLYVGLVQDLRAVPLLALNSKKVVETKWLHYYVKFECELSIGRLV